MEEKLQRCILVGVKLKSSREDLTKSLEELGGLVEAAGGTVVAIAHQERESIHPATFIGKGKLEEVRDFAASNDVDLVVFDDELSGAQLRNIEEALDCAVLDRTALILDIFARRAQSRIAKLQVELAQLKYRLPRLVGLGKSLSRTGGGIGTRGPGEQKLELDRRRINERIAEIRRRLREAEKSRETQRKKRQEDHIPVVSLIGYTNAGKSTLMNRIIGDHGDADKQVYVENMLFATLDTFSRKVVLADKKTFILNDTVGFISKLPHDLVEAFKATLEEVLEADLLLHVVDVSHDEMDRQLAVTERVLEEIGHGGQKTLVVYNKADRLQETPALPRPGRLISASTGAGVEELLAEITQEIFGDYKAVTLLIPYKRGDVESYLFNHYDVTILDHTEEGTLIRLEMPAIDRGRYRAYHVKDEV